MTTKTIRWLAGTLVALILLVLILYFFDWNLLRGFVERRVTQATGRSFDIAGDLDVKLRWRPVIIVNDVTLGNAPWSDTPVMATLKHAEVTLSIASLLRGQIALPVLRAEQLNLLLEKQASGAANWMFDNRPQPSSAQSRPVALGELMLRDSVVRYRSPVERADLIIKAATEDLPSSAQPAGASQSGQLLRIDVTGKYLDLDTKLQGDVGLITSLEDLKKRYPLNVQGGVGATQVRANGSIAEPLKLQGIEVEFALSGASLADLFPLIGVPLPPSPPYSIAGKLNQHGMVWDLAPFKGKIGSSDLRGKFAVDRGRQPQLITADVQSESLNLKDLSGFIGSRNESGQTVVKRDRVLPDLPLNLDKLHAADANVKFRGKRIQTTRLPIEDMNANLQLNDGKLQLKPLSFGVAQGSIDGLITLDANASPIEADADIKLHGLRLEQLFPGFEFEKASAGIIGGRAKLAGRGASVAKMLGSADGQVAFVMNGGSISKLVVRLANLDVANSIVVLLGGDRNVPIRCMVTDLTAQDGNLTINTMLLDTQKSLIEGSGALSLADESLDLKLRSDPKDISLVALRGPIQITGNFKHPKTGVALKNVVGRATLAAALGSLLGPLAFIPLLELGGGKDSDCGKMLGEIETKFGVKATAVRNMSYPVGMSGSAGMAF